MHLKDIRKQRMHNQMITISSLTKPEEVVKHLVAVQSQEYAQAKWALGMRMVAANDAIVEKAFNDGKILRTHVMRPTWHFVLPQDIRWLQQLTSPRVHKLSLPYYKKTGIDGKVMKKCCDALEKMLQGNNYLTRNEIKTKLEKAKILADGMKLSYLMMQAELDSVICSGPRHGKQFTYALVEERAPAVKAISREDALGKLVLQYFTTRGPATAHDFAWWSGLTMADANAGIEMKARQLAHEVMDGKTYYYSPDVKHEGKKQPATFLLPDYDEYGISYKDRTAIFGNANNAQVLTNIFGHTVIADGEAAGTWKRVEKGKETTVELSFKKGLNATKVNAINKAVDRYLKFIKP